MGGEWEANPEPTCDASQARLFALGAVAGWRLSGWRLWIELYEAIGLLGHD